MKRYLSFKEQVTVLNEFIVPAIEKYTDPGTGHEGYYALKSDMEIAEEVNKKYSDFQASPSNIRHIRKESFGDATPHPNKNSKLTELERRVSDLEFRLRKLEA